MVKLILIILGSIVLGYGVQWLYKLYVNDIRSLEGRIGKLEKRTGIKSEENE